jgi:uncharacterized protein (TIGR00369 family)
MTDLHAVPLGPLAQRMGIELTEASAERVSGRMPVEGNTQPYGLLHGGASVVLAETLGSIAAALYAGEHRRAVGIEINATHHRAVRTGTVMGTATPLHRGGTLTTYAVSITDQQDRPVCTARITCLLQAVRPLSGA